MVPVQQLGRSVYMASTYNFRSRPPCPIAHLHVADNLRSAQGPICRGTFRRKPSSMKQRHLTHSRTSETKETYALTIKTFLVLRNEAHPEPGTSTPHLPTLFLRHVAISPDPTPPHVTLFPVLYIRFSLQSHTNPSLHNEHCPPHTYDKSH